MSTPTRRALYGKMAGDTTLNNLLAAPPVGYAKNIYDSVAPGTATFPLVIFQKMTGTPTEAMNDPSALETDVWMVKAIDRNTSADTAEAIAARIQTLLNDATLSISGATHLYLRRQSDIGYPEDVDGVVFRHCGANYRLVFDP